MIAEVSRKSFGLGIELGWANVFEVPIISLCINGNKLSNSVKFLSQEINMNQIIEVKLTDYGKEIMKKKAPILYHHSTKNDHFVTELWQLFQTFGECMYNGNPEVPFVNNKIKIKE
jgi:hypothetical protein